MSGSVVHKNRNSAVASFWINCLDFFLHFEHLSGPLLLNYGIYQQDTVKVQSIRIVTLPCLIFVHLNFVRDINLKLQELPERNFVGR